MPSASTANQSMYDDLRERVESDETPDRRRSSVTRRGRRSSAYEGWTVVELRKRAKELGVSGYSGLNKDSLVTRLRNC